MRRVVVTGLGLVTPLGPDVEITWANLLAGRSGIRAIDTFEVADLPSRIAGMIQKDEGAERFDAGKYVEAKELRRNDDFIIYGIAAAAQAWADCGYAAETPEQRHRAGVQMGSGIGGLNTIAETTLILEKSGPRRVSPFFIPASLINLVAGQVSIRFGLQGPNHSAVTACSTGAHAIGDAARLIALDDADVMIAGGAEAAVGRLGMAGFAACKALSTHYNDTPAKASRPWDRGRDGFVMAEGAGAVVLEEYQHARRRGAHIYAEIKGYGLSGDAYHVTAPLPDHGGAQRAMQAAIKRSGLDVGAIDYINAHGTSTPLGDELEFGAVKRVLGDAAGRVSMSSTKSAIGHLLGAAGAVEAIFSILALRDQVVPPTLNLDDPEPSCTGIDLVPHEARRREVKMALSNSFGFGGTNACLIFTHPSM